MNRIEHLLTKLGEECAEIIKESSKTNIFGLYDYDPNDNTKTPNIKKLEYEINDMLAIVQMLQDEHILGPVGDATQIHSKKQKVEQFMEYAKDRGTLE